MDHLPARVTREEAQQECDRMNEIVKKNNERHIQNQGSNQRGHSFLNMKDDRVFGLKEIP